MATGKVIEVNKDRRHPEDRSNRLFTAAVYITRAFVDGMCQYSVGYILDINQVILGNFGVEWVL